MKIATCSIIRLENNYLIEFVEHYKKIGFDHMFIYDNNMEYDEHPEEVLQQYIDDGFVSIINYRDQNLHPMNDALIDAFKDCWNNNKFDYDWILFIDNDEFLNFSKDNNVKEYLSRDEINKSDIIRINWKCYDDNDLIYYEDKPLKERFTHLCWDDPYSFYENRHIKTFLHNTLRYAELDYGDAAAHSPLLNYILDKVVIDNSGKVLEELDVEQHANKEINYDLCWLDHYRMKTIDEYINNKIKKLTNQGYNKISFSSNIFFEYNHYSEEKEKLYLEKVAPYTKNCVYTVILGNYDRLNEPEYVTPGWDYICYTDNKELTSNVWKFIYVEDSWKNDFIQQNPDKPLYKINQYINRQIKLLPHFYVADYDFSIYVDGNIKITGDLNDFKRTYIDIPGSYQKVIWSLEHYRKCLYEEIDKCIELKKDSIDNLNKLKEFYISENVPKNVGMTHNCFLARYHLDQQCRYIMTFWWDMVINYTVRDQCSFMYVLNKYNLKDKLSILLNDDINKYVNYYNANGKHGEYKLIIKND